MGFTPKFNEDRTFGIEVEFYLPEGMSRQELAEWMTRSTGIHVAVEGYNHQTRGHWKIVTDASLGYADGAELVSPILAGMVGLEQIEMLCSVLTSVGARVKRSCGLHVHHDAMDFTTKTFVNLASLYVKLEGSIDSIMPPSRRESRNGMLRSVRMTDSDVASIERRINHIKGARNPREVSQRLNGGDRYHKLNMGAAYERQGTVEFRQHSGTVEAEKIIAWVKLTQSMVERACQARVIKAQGTDNFEIIIRFCPDRKTKAFYRARQKHFINRERRG